jgi:soluble lytic murein transglycosylase-like protein
MKKVLMTAVLFMGVASLTLPAHGQLSSYVDEHGNLVYINANPAPKKRTLGTPSAAPAANQKAPESKGAGPNSSATDHAQAIDRPLASDRVVRTEALHQIVREKAEKHNVDPALVSAVISTESNWNTSALSSKGAQGLMQLVPGTAQRLGVFNVWDPEENVDAGVRYLRSLLERYNGDLPKALAAYNAGPSVVDRWGGIPNYRETRDYVRKVTDTYFRPGSNQQPFSRAASRQIYRTTAADGRVVFTNE